MRDNAKGGALTEVTFYILLVLFNPAHGYAIMQFVKKETGGRLRLGVGSLYGALCSLEDKGWIALSGKEEVRRKEYQITELGVKVAEKELVRLHELVQVAERTIQGGKEESMSVFFEEGLEHKKDG